MAHTKRNRQQLASDRLEITRLYLRGLTQTEIAARMGVSQPQISYDLRLLREQWQAAAATELAERRAEETARLDLIEREQWEGFHRSQEGGRDGNPRFLNGILQCVSARLRLYGLDKPQTVEVTAKEAESELGYLQFLTDKEVLHINDLYRTAKERMEAHARQQPGAPGSLGTAPD